MAWLWARIHTRGGSKNENGEEVLGYMDGGFGEIIRKLAEKVEIKVGQAQDLPLHNFDLVIDTRPEKNVEYLGAINLVFSSKQSLSEYYWHNINDLKSPFLVMVQHTNLMGNNEYNGKNIYYLGTYIPQNHKYFKVSDKEIEKEFFDYLKKIKLEFDKKQIEEKKIFKMKNAQHIVTTNYKVPNYKVGKNLYQLNFSQIYPEDRGINFAVREAKKLVKIIVS
jgi:protoporphyrinogen oxidase